MTKLATDSFELALPDTWRIETLKNPATVIGPGGECLMINSAVISGGGSERDFEAVRQALQENAEDSMQNAARDERLRITGPLKTEHTTGGWLCAEMHCRTTDDSTFFSEFSIAGPSTLVFVTLEGPVASEGAIDLVRAAVKAITWAQKSAGSQQALPKKKPFWRFW